MLQRLDHRGQTSTKAILQQGIEKLSEGGWTGEADQLLRAGEHPRGTQDWAVPQPNLRDVN